MTGTVLGRSAIRLLLGVLLVAGLSTASGGSAAADTPASIANKVHLKVLVLSDGSTNVSAIATQLDREGVPTTVVEVGTGSGPVIDRAFLADDVAHEARFQGVVVPSTNALSPTEMAALAGFERDYGIREVVAYAYPNASLGMTVPAYAGVLDGSPLTVAPAGATAGFAYLSGRLRVDDVDAATSEVYGYLASALNPLPAGESYMPLIQATAGGVSGSVVGVHTANGRSRMIITAAFSAHQRYFQDIGHGIVTWLTRGIHLGYQRNYFAVHVDDVLMADSQWTRDSECPVGSTCPVPPTGPAAPVIRMQPADVTNLVQWQRANNVALDMVFNGGGSDDYLAMNGLSVDPLASAFTANAGSFKWINHTLDHAYLGCIQVAMPDPLAPWRCATPSDYADPTTPFVEPDLAADSARFDAATGFYFLTRAKISEQISDNLTWAQQHGIATDPVELVTGEHSGLAILPQQPMDNPSFGAALADNQISVVAGDASRDANSRTVGSARTVPRHPMNLFYNASTYLSEVGEYNWYYTSRADGGGGACELHPDTTRCITPLPAGTESQAEASFNGYIVPLEARNALSFVLSNDPRPFYVHQSNLTDQRILFPVLDAVISSYRSVYRDATTPLVHLTMSQQADALTRMTAWKAAMTGVDAYVDSTGVHVAGGSAAAIPITMPSGATVNGMSVEPYGGEQSGWIAPGAASGVAIGLPAPAGGYIGVPVAPTIGPATPANAAATVTWTAGSDRGSPVTGYTVRAYIGANVNPSVTVSTSSDALSLTVTELINYAPYYFTVTADSAVGSSEESVRSAMVIPAPSVPAAPQLVGATAGDGSVAVTWQSPADGGSPVTLFSVRLYPAGSDTAVFSQDVAATERSAAFTGLTNGQGYTLDVFAYNIVGAGPASARSAVVTPQGAPPTTTLATTTTATESTTTTPATTVITSSTVLSTMSSTSSSPPSTSSTTAPPSTSSTTAPPSTSSTTAPPSTSSTTAPPSTTATTAPSTAPPRVPGVPRLTSLTPGNGFVTLRWTAPAANGSPLISYVVAVYRPGVKLPVRTIKVAAPTTTLRVDGLVNGVAYQFTVQAVNAVGAGRASGRSGSVKPRGIAPSRPRPSVALTGSPPDAGTVMVRWAVPSSDGGSLVTGFVVVARRLDSSGMVSSTGTFLVSSPSVRAWQMRLSPANYTFTVRAVNRYGMGTPSAPSNVVTVQ